MFHSETSVYDFIYHLDIFWSYFCIFFALCFTPKHLYTISCIISLSFISKRPHTISYIISVSFCISFFFYISLRNIYLRFHFGFSFIPYIKWPFQNAHFTILFIVLWIFSPFIFLIYPIHKHSLPKHTLWIYHSPVGIFDFRIIFIYPMCSWYDKKTHQLANLYVLLSSFLLVIWPLSILHSSKISTFVIHQSHIKIWPPFAATSLPALPTLTRHSRQLRSQHSPHSLAILGNFTPNTPHSSRRSHSAPYRCSAALLLQRKNKR